MDIQELVKNHSAQLIEKIITEVLSKPHVDVHFDFFEKDQWAAVTINQYEEDEIDSLPDGIKKIMKKVVNDEDGLRVASSLLTPPKKS